MPRWQTFLEAGDEAGHSIRTPPVADSPALHMALGIDLGTSCARMAVWKEGDVMIIKNDAGSTSTPCWVAFTETGVLFGEAAQGQAEANMANTIFAPQRLMGFRIDNPWVQWYGRRWPGRMVCGEDDKPLLRVRSRGQELTFRPEDLVAMLLVYLRRCAEHVLGHRVLDAVLTVPAQYGMNQRRAIEEACAAADLNVTSLIKAPVAGAIAFSLMNPARARGNLLVCDMGSDYFDFALLTFENQSTLTEWAFGTDHVDLNRHLVNLITEDLKENYQVAVKNDPRIMQKLQMVCESAKRRLSQSNQAHVEVNHLIPDLNYSCALLREHFEESCREDLQHVLEVIALCLEEIGVERFELDEVLLLGGSANIPIVKRVLREFFYGRKPVEVFRPEHGAVLGAAAYAAILISGHKRNTLPEELQALKLHQVLPWSVLPGPGQAEYGATPVIASDLGAKQHLQCFAAPPQPRTRCCFSTLKRPRSLLDDADMPRSPRGVD